MRIRYKTAPTNSTLVSAADATRPSPPPPRFDPTTNINGLDIDNINAYMRNQTDLEILSTGHAIIKALSIGARRWEITDREWQDIGKQVLSTNDNHRIVRCLTYLSLIARGDVLQRLSLPSATIREIASRVTTSQFPPETKYAEYKAKLALISERFRLSDTIPNTEVDQLNCALSNSDKPLSLYQAHATAWLFLYAPDERNQIREFTEDNWNELKRLLDEYRNKRDMLKYLKMAFALTIFQATDARIKGAGHLEIGSLKPPGTTPFLPPRDITTSS